MNEARLLLDCWTKTLTLKTSAQVVETSGTKNSSFQYYSHPDYHASRPADTPGFKTIYYVKIKWQSIFQRFALLFIYLSKKFLKSIIIKFEMGHQIVQTKEVYWCPIKQ